jgi:hypothetical protein
VRAALGDRYEQALAQARTIDLDRAVAELIESDPVAKRLSESRDGSREPRNRPGLIDCDLRSCSRGDHADLGRACLGSDRALDAREPLSEEGAQEFRLLVG